MIGLSKNGIIIGAVKYHDRKKPCLIIREGNCDLIIGYFINEHCVESFEKAILKILEKGGVNDDR